MEKLGLAEMADLAVMRSKCNDLMWLKRQNKGSAGTFVVKLLIKKKGSLNSRKFLFSLKCKKMSSERETFFKKIN